MNEQNEQNPSNEIVHAWPRNDREQVQITLTRYRRNRRVDLRVWITEANQPTKRGLSLTPEELPRLKTGIEAAERKLKEERKAS